MKLVYSSGEGEKSCKDPQEGKHLFKKHTEAHVAENDLRSVRHDIKKAPKGNTKDCPIALTRT